MVKFLPEYPMGFSPKELDILYSHLDVKTISSIALQNTSSDSSYRSLLLKLVQLRQTVLDKAKNIEGK